MPLDFAQAGGGNESNQFVEALDNVIQNASLPNRDDGTPMRPGFYSVTDFAVVSDQEGKGRMVSFLHGPHVSYGSGRLTTEVPGELTEGADVLTYNRLTWEGRDTDPLVMIGGEFLPAQSNVRFFPIAVVSYNPIIPE